ncbi:MAG TPA: hypothetical protein PKD55_00005 [Bellilinea sp.]|nr:hypothetical protein [Bellilinea sp.]
MLKTCKYTVIPTQITFPIPGETVSPNTVYLVEEFDLNRDLGHVYRKIAYFIREEDAQSYALHLRDRFVVEQLEEIESNLYELVCQLLPPKGGSLQVGSGGYAVGRMALCSLTARVWLIDSSPAGNIHRRDVVGEPGVSAGHTGEGALVRTIGFRDMPALRTGLRRVAWVNCNDRNTRQRRLVLDFCPEIAKGPAMQLSPVRLTSRYPVADARQVLDGDPASGVFGALYKLLADAVVHVSGKAVFFAAALLEQAFSRLRALLLELRPQAGVAVTQAVQVGAAVVVAVAVSGDVRHTGIDAEIPANILRLRRLDFAGDEQVELATNIAQVGFTPVAFQQLSLAVTTQVAHALAALQCPDAHRLFVRPEAQDAVVVGKRTARLEGALRFAVELVGVSDLRYRSHDHLSRQREAVADVVVDEAVELELAKDFAIPRLPADVVADGIGRLQSLEQRVVLVGRGLQLDLGREFHIVSIHQKGGWRNSSPR